MRQERRGKDACLGFVYCRPEPIGALPETCFICRRKYCEQPVGLPDYQKGLGSHRVSVSVSVTDSGTRNGTQHANDPSSIESYGACLSRDTHAKRERKFPERRDFCQLSIPLGKCSNYCLVPRTIDSIDGNILILIVRYNHISSSCNHPHCRLYFA